MTKYEHSQKVDFKKSLKLLAVGNSFSVDSMEYLWNIAKDYGVEEVILGNLYIGGCTLKTHWNNAKNNLPAYIYYKNSTGSWTSEDNKSILDGLKDEKWDLISIQQASGSSGVVSTYNEDLLNLIQYIQEHKRNVDAKLMWNMTWAYSQDSNHGEYINYNHDQITMYEAIVNAVKHVILRNEDISFVIPTGTAIQNMRTSFVGDTLTRDGYHLSLDLGRYVAGMTWFKKITGFSIDDIYYFPTGISKEEVKVVKEAVNRAIDNPYSVSRL